MHLFGGVSALLHSYLLIEVLLPGQVCDRRIDTTAQVLKHHDYCRLPPRRSGGVSIRVAALLRFAWAGDGAAGLGAIPRGKIVVGCRDAACLNAQPVWPLCQRCWWPLSMVGVGFCAGVQRGAISLIRLGFSCREELN
jgi:hypothetical protein